MKLKVLLALCALLLLSAFIAERKEPITIFMIGDSTMANKSLKNGTYIGVNSTIAENYGKAVVRRTAYTTEDGRKVLQDTNNSSVDFEPSVRATLLPAQ